MSENECRNVFPVVKTGVRISIEVPDPLHVMTPLKALEITWSK